jgi:hypothetical protein
MPEMNVDFLASINQTAPGLLDQADKISVPGEDWISSVSRALQTVAMADYQRRIVNVQLERAKQGLPPLDSSNFGLGVSVGISPQIMLLGVGAIVALFMLARRR